MYKTTVKIEGMMCGMCESHVNDAIRRALSVKKIVSSHRKGLSEILSPQPPDEEALRAAIEQTGYTVVSVATEPYEKTGFSLFHRSV